jgi:hypothetical protein
MICDGDVKSFNNINNIMIKRKIFEINRKYNYLNTNSITDNNEIYKNNIKKEVYYYDKKSNIYFIVILLNKNVGKFDILVYSYNRIKKQYYNNLNSYIIGIDSDTI